MDLVSVLVPIYNVEKYLERCLVSLFEQDFQFVEYIFVNDASTDNSMNILNEVIERYPHRKKQVKIIHHQANRGLASARRTAIENASSPYVMHVDSDDYIALNMLSLMYDKVCAENSDLVISDIMIMYPRQKQVEFHIDWEIYKDKWEYLSDILTRKTLVNIWGKLIRKDIIINNSIYAGEGENQGEDYQVIPKIVYYANKISSVKALYYYDRTNVNSYTNNVNLEGLCDIIKAQNILNDFFAKKKEISKKLIEESCVYNKLTLLLLSSYNHYPMLAKLYSDVDLSSIKLKKSHLVILQLLSYKQYMIVYFMVRMYKLIKHY